MKSVLPMILAGLLSTQAASGSPKEPAAHTECLPGCVVVKLRSPSTAGLDRTQGSARNANWFDVPGAELRRIEPILAAAAAGLDAESSPLANVYLVHYAGARDPQEVAAALAKHAEVLYAEPRFVHRIEAIPNDPGWFYQQRYFVGYPVPLPPRMQFPEAWDVVRAEDGDVVVAIVDGGTDWDHPDLAANIWTNPGEIDGNGVDDDGNGFVDDIRGWNFANSSNDPTGLPSTPGSAQHGTHVAGIVGAVTDNGVGIAGAAWNPRIMPICSALEGQDGAIAFGFEGILYAAANGADIINCSWGAVQPASRFEQEVITWAAERGCVVVASAGNSEYLPPHYPSDYDHVLSVSAVEENDFPYAGFGFHVDVSAQGYVVWSTLPNGGYGDQSGTSMAAAMATAACALLRTRWPGLAPDEVIERIRATSDNIDGQNRYYAGLMGHGRLNVLRALTAQTPGIRITGIDVSDEDGDGVIEPGEVVSLGLTVKNFLDPATSVTFVLRHELRFAEYYEEFARVTHGSASIPAIAAGAAISLPPFTVKVREDAPADYEFYGVLEIVAASPVYSDLDFFTLRVQPTFVTHDANALLATVTATGKLGHTTIGSNSLEEGAGVRFKGSNDVLSQGSLMLGTSAAQISDAASSIYVARDDDDWVTVQDGSARLHAPGRLSDQESFARFDDSGASTPLGVLVTQEGYAFASVPDDDYLVLKYSIQNTTSASISGLHVGWFCDWDVDRSTPSTNRTGFDAARQLGYVWDDQGGAGGSYFGICVLTAPGATSYRGIYVDPQAPGNPSWGILDGFNSQEKWEALSGGVVFPEAGPADVAQAIATGPYDIPPGGVITVAFAIVAGENLADLRANADAAQERWTRLPTSVAENYSLSAVATGSGVLLQWRLAPEVEASLAGIGVQRALRAAGPYVERSTQLAPRPFMSFEDANDEEASTFWYRLRLAGRDGFTEFSGPVRVDGVGSLRTGLRSIFDLPNGGPMEIKYSIVSAVERAKIEIFDVTGRRVVRLDQGPRTPGIHTATWDRRGSSGQDVARGIYLVRLVAGDARSSRKALVAR